MPSKLVTQRQSRVAVGVVTTMTFMKRSLGNAKPAAEGTGAKKERMALQS